MALPDVDSAELRSSMQEDDLGGWQENSAELDLRNNPEHRQAGGGMQ